MSRIVEEFIMIMDGLCGGGGLHEEVNAPGQKKFPAQIHRMQPAQTVIVEI